MTTPQLKDDIKFLLSFAPALSPDDVTDGLSSMFYITTTYKGDLALAERVEAICERYDININDFVSDDEEGINI